MNNLYKHTSIDKIRRGIYNPKSYTAENLDLSHNGDVEPEEQVIYIRVSWQACGWDCQGEWRTNPRENGTFTYALNPKGVLVMHLNRCHIGIDGGGGGTLNTQVYMVVIPV